MNELSLNQKRRDADISLEKQRLVELEKSRELITRLQNENMELADELDKLKMSQETIVEEEVRALKELNEDLKAELEQKINKVGQKSKMIA
jgi:chromosome segregation ATPase